MDTISSDDLFCLNLWVRVPSVLEDLWPSKTMNREAWTSDKIML
jgi:hypothetical protein